jgi:hypothetical protein
VWEGSRQEDEGDAAVDVEVDVAADVVADVAADRKESVDADEGHRLVCWLKAEVVVDSDALTPRGRLSFEQPD